MPRSGAEARERLELAALELYGAHGYDHTTTAEIANRAGVTERTYFRHFADKREVLFNIEVQLQDLLAASLADVPPSVGPLAMMLQAFRAVAPFQQENRELAVARHRIISTTPALREREMAKAASMAALVAEALRARGMAAPRDTLVAAVGTAALGHCIGVWLREPDTDLGLLLDAAFSDLATLADISWAEGG